MQSKRSASSPPTGNGAFHIFCQVTPALKETGVSCQKTENNTFNSETGNTVGHVP